jgi:hypothetical protein
MPGVQQSCGDTPVVAFLCKAPLRTSIEDFMPDKEGEQNTDAAQDKKPKKVFLTNKKFFETIKCIQKCFLFEPCYVHTIKQHLAHDINSGSPTVMTPKVLYKIIQPSGDARNKYCVKSRGTFPTNPYSYIAKQENTEKIFLMGTTPNRFKKWFKCDEITHWLAENKIPVKDCTHEEICPMNMKALRYAVYKMIDWTNQRSEIIMDAILAAYFPVPLNRLEYQAMKANIIMLTNSNVGKSWAYYNMTGTQPSEHFTQRGLFGGYSKDESFEEGAMAGSGMEMIDEFANKTVKEDEKSVIEDLLNYNVFGKVVRKIKGKPSCTGTKTVILSGNIVFSFKKIMQCLSPDLKSTEMLGRRYPYFIYMDDVPAYTTKQLESKHEKHFKETYRNVLETIFFEYESKLWKIIDNNMRIIVADKDFEERLQDLSTRAEEYWLSDFIKGCKQSTQCIMFMAFGQWCLLNLDKIVLGHVKKLGKEQVEEVENIYQRKKKVILESFENIVQEKEKFIKFMEELTRLTIPSSTPHLSSEIVATLSESVGISRSTVYRWWNRMQSMRGIRRT